MLTANHDHTDAEEDARGTPRLYYPHSQELFSHFEEIGGQFIGGPEDENPTFAHDGAFFVYRWIQTGFPQFDHWKMIEDGPAKIEAVLSAFDSGEIQTTADLLAVIEADNAGAFPLPINSQADTRTTQPRLF